MKDLAKYALFCALAACAGCGKSGIEEPPVPPPPPEPVEVTFTTEVRTRVQREGVVTGFETGDEMTLFRTNSGKEAASTVKIASEEGIWRGTPAVMLEAQQSALFQALYPFLATAIDPAACPVTAEAQVDYLYSGPAVEVAAAKPRALLTMRHAQAIVAFNLHSYIGGELRAIELDDERFPLAGTMNLSDGTITPTQVGPFAFDCPRRLTAEGWQADHPSCFVFPQTLADGQCAAVFRIGEDRYRVPLPAMTLVAGNKYILDFSLTAQGAALNPDRTQVVTLDAGGGAAGDPYGCLRVTHRNDSYTVPMFTGSAVYGMIYWDEATSEPYAVGAIHGYGSEGPHTVVFDLWQADAVQFPDLSGIERIDLSEF